MARISLCLFWLYKEMALVLLAEIVQLDWKSIFSIKGGQLLERLLTQHSNVFRGKLGTVKDVKVKLYVKENSTPKFF